MPDFSLSIALEKKILPAVTFDNEENVLPVVETFLKAGLSLMEIPFRTGVAEKAITLIRNNFSGMYIGAGTLLSTDQLHKAINAGAHFGLSPGLNQSVCNEAKRLGFPFIPGVMTPSEMERADELGYTIQKIFPADQLGGVSFLKAMQGPYEQLGIQFIPMGGVNIQNMGAYLLLKNVIAVGGSWLASKELMRVKDYKAIADNIKAALQNIKQINE
ncbi:MAG: bifunctional 4-hydroxy-2-oxoglutarate aldolase/2-dehydro-3-deoxy-phosphogluconate aldolase [Ginsengibacter sp.]